MSSAQIETAIAFAQEQIGDPYRFGGTGPNSWDCSGLVQAAYAAAGVSIPRTSRGQYAGLTHVPLASVVRGDLVFMGPTPLLIHHVVLALGNGMCIAAPHTGDVVKLEHLSVFRDTYPTAARPVASSSSSSSAPTVRNVLSLPNLPNVPNPLNLPGDAASAAAGAVEGAIANAVSGVWTTFTHGAIKYGAVGAGVALIGAGLYRAVAARPTGES